MQKYIHLTNTLSFIIVSAMILLSPLNITGADKNLYKQWTSILPEGSAIEMYSVTIGYPSDACDCPLAPSIDGSGYSKTLKVYRSKKSGNIISIHYDLYPCQGDGHYGNIYYFNPDGTALYGWETTGIYGNTMVTIYSNGKPVENTYPKALKEKKNASVDSVMKEAIKTLNLDEKKLEKQAQSVHDSIKKAKKDKSFSLCGMIKGKDAVKLLASFKKSLDQGISTLKKKKFISAGTWSRPLKITPGESKQGIVIGKNVRVRSKPGTAGKVVGKVGYLNGNVKILKSGKKATIKPWGTHHWYEINYPDYSNGDDVFVTGWVFGAFIAPGIY